MEPLLMTMSEIEMSKGVDVESFEENLSIINWKL